MSTELRVVGVLGAETGVSTEYTAWASGGGAKVTHVGSVVQEEWSALALGISHEVSGERHIPGL